MIISFSAWVKIVEIKRWCSRIVLLERGFMLLEIVKRSFTLKPSALTIAVAVGTVTVEPFRAIPIVLGLSYAFFAMVCRDILLAAKNAVSVLFATARMLSARRLCPARGR